MRDSATKFFHEGLHVQLAAKLLSWVVYSSLFMSLHGKLIWPSQSHTREMFR